MSDQDSSFSVLNSRRRAINTFRLPGFQVNLPATIVMMSLAFAAAAVWLEHSTYDSIMAMEPQTSGESSYFASLIEDQIRSALVALGMLVSVYMILVVGLWVRYSRKVMGPEVAFRRHVEALKNGDYAARVELRDGDAFVELAGDLNELAAILGSNEKPDERREAEPTV